MGRGFTAVGITHGGLASGPLSLLVTHPCFIVRGDVVVGAVRTYLNFNLVCNL
jgi:hypothetical protein